MPGMYWFPFLPFAKRFYPEILKVAKESKGGKLLAMLTQDSPGSLRIPFDS